ncbi:helix-turn-helix domain-containing protein [Mucilaginibacter sp.]|jgi:AraC-like DNA-binding protein|uniref:helix-turn-helix domain-containing protein n=1 Tax=Mucilaginibacter sp. TaxID=1882438 RepID=UPI0035680E1D
MSQELTANISLRKQEITTRYIEELDKHLADLKAGLLETSLEINDFADLLFITPTHLSDTIKDVLGKSPCNVYEEKLIKLSKELLLNTNKTISEIAVTLTYDPSNFTKFFKRFAGMTPKEFRNQHLIKLTSAAEIIS